jgi:hypothetical protein
MSTARETQASTTSSSSSAYAAGGSGTTSFAGTEEWDAPATFNQITQGQLFFNSTANAFKETIKDIPGASWASSVNVNTARGWGAQGQFGSPIAALLIGGRSAAPASTYVNTESWNGSAWTEVNDLNGSRYAMGGAGTQTSAIVAAGTTGVLSETWDGTSWTEVAEVNTQRYGSVGTGSSSSDAQIQGGESSGFKALTEQWNGSAWTEVADLNTARYALAGFGTTSSTQVAGGALPSSPYYTANSETWDGSSWTEVNNLNTARGGAGIGGSGTQTNGLAYGGESSPGSSGLAITEFWNGSTFTELADLSQTRQALGSAGTGATGALAMSGLVSTPTVTAATEEWTASLSNKTITAS